MVRTLQSLFVVIGLLLASMFVIAGQAQQVGVASLGKFPALDSETLEKKAVSLPQDFQGERNLLLIAFKREQQKDIDTWLMQMKRYEDIDKGFRYYEMEYPFLCRDFPSSEQHVRNWDSAVKLVDDHCIEHSGTVAAYGTHPRSFAVSSYDL